MRKIQQNDDERCRAQTSLLLIFNVEVIWLLASTAEREIPLHKVDYYEANEVDKGTASALFAMIQFPSLAAWKAMAKRKL